MTVIPVRPLWAGRTAVVVGILLLALNLRTAVAVLSPILGLVSEDIPLGSLGIGLLGMLPPLAFAASGFVAPLVARRIGLELTLVLASCAMVAGPLIRAVAPSYPVLVAGSVVVLAGMGFANIVLPPVIKKYFPDRVGLLTATYLTVMSISAAVPPLIAAPLADAIGWRPTVGAWGLLALAAIVPWLVVLSQHRAQDRSAEGAVVAPPALLGRMGRSRVAWAIALMFAVTSLNVYGMFAWLPELLIDVAGSSPAEAGAMLSLYALIGLPAGLLIPVLAPRLRNVGWLVAVGIVLYLLGYLGLLLAPTPATVLWVVLIGAGPLLFPLALVLVNLRTRSHQASAALSGFVQGIGYAVGALGPLVIGVIHDLTGQWSAVLLFLVGTALLVSVSAVLLVKPRTVEEELGLS